MSPIRLTPADVRVFDQLVAHLDRPQQLRAGRELLADSRIANHPIVRGPLAAIRSGLEGVSSAEAGVAQLLDGLRGKIDEQIANLDGAGVLVGSTYHHDYQAVGHIRQQLDLLAAGGVI